jgi:hypothetical protein
MRITRKVSQIPLVKGVQEIKEMDIADFRASKFKEEMEEKDFLLIKETKSGYIFIRKISNNSGYLSNNEGRNGFTPMFSEGLSCYIFLDDLHEDYYYTSVIESIDWENKIFTTINSKYSFEFKEMSPEEYDKTVL